MVPTTLRLLSSTPAVVPSTPGVVTSGPGVVPSTAAGVPSTLGVVPSTQAEQGSPLTPIEFTSPPSDITEFVDAFHNIIGSTRPSGLAGWLLNDPELLLISIEEPPTFALAERDANWQWAMLEEMKVIEENKTLELVNPPLGCRPIGLKWVYKVKQDEHGAILKHKARLIARGFVQREGIDFEEVFAPVA